MNSRIIKSNLLKVPAEEWAQKWIPNIMDQKQFVARCNEDGYTEFDAETFHDLIEKYGFKSDGSSGYIKNSRIIKSDSLDDFKAGKMDNSKEYFKMSFHIAPNGSDYRDIDAMVTAGNEYTDGAWDSTHVDIVATNVTSRGLTTAVVKNNPIAIAQLISDIRSFEEQGGYHAWFFHFTTTNERDAKPTGIWVNSLSNSEWTNNDIETIDRLIQDKMSKSIESSKAIKSSQKGFENVVENTQYDDYHIDTRGQGILDVENIIDGIESRGNQAVLTVQTSDGSTNHSQFGSKEWKEYKDSVNNAGNAITDVWVTEVEGGSYVRNSRQIKSARYIATDPESGEVLGSADTYEEAVNQWGEDVTITDSEAAEGQENMDTGLFSSKRSIKSSNLPEEVYYIVVNGSKQYYNTYNDAEKDLEYLRQYGNGNVGGVYTETDPEEIAELVDVGYIKSSISAAVLKEQLDGQFWTRTEDFEDEVNDAGWDVEDVNDEYATISNDKGSQYEVRFGDHGEGSSFTMDSFKCIYCDEDDDDEIESSKKPSGDKAFLSKIVSAFCAGTMTEEQAVKRVMLRNNCNIGYARQILSNAMDDASLIQSGTMEIAEDLNKDFNVDGNIESWSEDYIPQAGKANTIGGEILRATAQIVNRFYNDGDKIGIGNGKETVNPAARYILENAVEFTAAPDDLQAMLDNNSDINLSDESYEEWVDDFKYEVEDYLREHEELFHAPNKVDMWDFKQESDEKTPVTDIFIEDDDGNRYSFQGGPEGWHCYDIYFADGPKYNVGDFVNSGDIQSAGGDTSEEFVTFNIDGYTYSAELYDNDEYEITDIESSNQLVHKDEEWTTEDLEKYKIYNSEDESELSIEDLY